jgi:hypothetical protein
MNIIKPMYEHRRGPGAVGVRRWLPGQSAACSIPVWSSENFSPSQNPLPHLRQSISTGLASRYGTRPSSHHNLHYHPIIWANGIHPTVAPISQTYSYAPIRCVEMCVCMTRNVSFLGVVKQTNKQTEKISWTDWRSRRVSTSCPQNARHTHYWAYNLQ